MVTANGYRMTVDWDGDGATVRLRGVIDACAAAALSELLAPVDGPFNVDLSEVESMDADGLARLLEMCARRSWPAVITATSPAAARAISGLILPPNLSVEPLLARVGAADSGSAAFGLLRPSVGRSLGILPLESPPGASLPPVSLPPVSLPPERQTARSGRAVTTARQVSLSRQLRAHDSVDAIMRCVEQLAPEFTGCTYAHLMSGKDKDRPSDASTALETCLRSLAADCLGAEDHFVVADLAADPRWPTPERATGGDDDAAVGALAWFLPNGAGRRPAALVLVFPTDMVGDEQVLQSVEAYAEVADVAVGYKYANEQLESLRSALASNREIGTAMGILMATRHVSDEEAFDLLRSVSQHTHRKLNLIASEVVYTGMLPT